MYLKLFSSAMSAGFCCALCIPVASLPSVSLFSAARAQILRSKPPGSRIIIFCSTKRMCDQLSMQLSREFRAAAIHGDKRQQERDHVIASFKDGRMPIM